MNLKKHLPLAAAALLAGTSVAARADVVAQAVSSADTNVTAFAQTPAAGSFTSAGDGFELYQRGVSAAIPFGLLDDSTTFTTDALGIVQSGDTSPFFGVIDITNDDNLAGNGTATWTFDVSGATGPLNVSVDLAAMGDFEGPDNSSGDPAQADDFSFQIGTPDGLGGFTFATVLATVVADDSSLTYTLESGATFDLDDPLVAGTTTLNNTFQTLGLADGLSGAGGTLAVRFLAHTDGGSEAFALRNIVVSGSVPEPTSLGLLGVGGVALLRRRRA